MKSNTRKAASRISASSVRTPTHQEITALAETLWIERNRPLDADVEIWLEAERQLGRPQLAKAQKGIVSGHLVDTGPFSDASRDGSLMGQLDQLYPGATGRETTSL